MLAVKETPSSPERVRHLEDALTRTVLAYHLQHVMATGPSWNACDHPLCLAAKRLLPSLHN
jgi:hypothetical protein